MQNVGRPVRDSVAQKAARWTLATAGADSRVAELLAGGDELARLYDLIEIVLTERLLKT
jgi:hypothetical protein